MNIDWFQPFKDISYSVGVIYDVILNLPRNIRYKDCNVIIVGVIPGPKEPKHDVNSYFGPLVTELYTGKHHMVDSLSGVSYFVFHLIYLRLEKQLDLLDTKV